MYEYSAVVINVVDGDTVDARIDLGFYMTAALRLRLSGVNCPEMHGPDHDRGLAAKQFTIAHLMGRSVMIRTRKSDSFGRWLAAVEVDGRSFNEWLVAEGHAVPYMVGKDDLGG